MPDYRFRVLGARVVDGDTAYVSVVVRPAMSAFRVNLEQTTADIEVRLDGWDCPEKRSSATRVISVFERSEAMRAESVARFWITDRLAAGEVWVQTEKDPEKYGRWLGAFSALSDASQLGLVLEAEELAVRYHAKPGEKRWYQVFDVTSPA